MKINLRKAVSLQSTIREAIDNIVLPTSITIDEFQDAEKHVDQSREKFDNALSKHSTLTAVLYDIRHCVSQANEGKINKLLSDIALVSSSIKVYEYNGFGDLKPTIGSSELNARVNRLRSSDDSGYRHQTSITVDVLSQSRIDELRESYIECKRAKTRLQEELLQANVNTYIELDQSTVDYLTKLGII